MTTWKRDPEQREDHQGHVLAARERPQGWLLELDGQIVRQPNGEGPRYWVSAARALQAGRKLVAELGQCRLLFSAAEAEHVAAVAAGRRPCRCEFIRRELLANAFTCGLCGRVVSPPRS